MEHIHICTVCGAELECSADCSLEKIDDSNCYFDGRLGGDL
jgi:transcription elongation factor Elf1